MNHFSTQKNKNRRSKKAQGMVEFALILPILMLTLVGLLEFGRLFYAWLIIENSTRFGIRYATAGTYDIADCQDLDGDGTLCGGASENLEIRNARLPAIERETKRVIVGFHADESYAQSAIEYLNITVCSNETNFVRPQMRIGDYYAECTVDGTRNSAAIAENAGDAGEQVFVAADYNFTFIVLPIFGFEPMVHIASYRAGINESFQIAQIVQPAGNPNPGGGGFVVPSNTPTPSPTSTPTNTPTATATYTPTITSTPSNTPTPSFTPTTTNTPTVTPVPVCSNIIVSNARWSSDDFLVTVTNNNVAVVSLTNSSLTWDTTYAVPAGNTTTAMYFNEATFNGSRYATANSWTSPVNNTASPAIGLNGQSAANWFADFNNKNFKGAYGVTLTFDLGGTGTCTIPINAVVPTSVPTNTPRPTRTPTRTPTITNTPTITRTPTITNTPTITRTPTITNTPTNTRTPTATVPSPTRTSTRTPTATVPTPTYTNTSTPLPPTNTRTPTPNLPTNTPTIPPSPTATFCIGAGCNG